MEFYNFKANSLQGKQIDFSEFEGKAVLVVNTASKCGLTPQYEGLEQLYQTYKDQGFVVLGFPCNQFGNQEPGDAGQIKSECLVNYGVSFPMFEKIDVNGANAHPLFVYLKDSLHGFFGKDIKWNFTKFLIDKQGKPVKRYAPTTVPTTIEKDLKKYL